MADIILSVKNLTKIFNNKLAVNNISFQVEAGQIFGLLGPSGSGKTTVMRIICGFCNFNKGSVKICNHSIYTDKKRATENLGCFIETPRFFESMSGYSNLKYFAKLSKIKSKEKIINCATIVGLKDQLNKKVSKYTTGMKQKLGIAQALLTDPKLLIFDEPLTGLDINSMNEIRTLLKYISKQENVSIVLSSHMLGEMEELCDVIAVMNNGQIEDIKTIAQLKDQSEYDKKLQITVDYPNFAGKIVLNELKHKVSVAGNSIIVYTAEESLAKIIERLKAYHISIFKIEYITKSLAQVFNEILQRKVIDKNWLEWLYV